jgi:hypothetical protein
VPVKAPMLGKQPAPPVGQINGTDRPVGPPIPVQKLRQPGRSKRPLMLALMVLLMVVSALAVWFFVQKSTERVAVVGVAHDVAWGQEIQASDLVTVEMVPDPALKPVSWDQRSTLVGQLAATDLQTGMLLTAGSVTDVQVPPPGKALVGVLVKSGQVPVTPLSPQDQVLLVLADQQAVPSVASAAAAAAPVEAEVYTVGATDANGTRTVDVLVPQASAAQTAAAAAAGRLAIVLVPRS